MSRNQRPGDRPDDRRASPSAGEPGKTESEGAASQDDVMVVDTGSVSFCLERRAGKLAPLNLAAFLRGRYPR